MTEPDADVRCPDYGKAVLGSDDLIHIASHAQGFAVCGAPWEALKLRWDVETLVHCRACLDWAMRLD